MDVFKNDLVKLSDFAALARDFALCRTLPETIERVMHHIGKVFGPLSWSLLLRNFQDGTLKFVHATGPGSGVLHGLVLEKGVGVAGWVADHGESLLIADTGKDARFHGGIDKVSGFETKSIIAVPLTAREQVYGVIELINKLDESRFTTQDLLVLQTISDFAAIAIERAYYHRAIQRLALTDSLTGIHNRRSFEQVLTREVEKTRRSGTLFALLLLDVDHFKAINDKYGHPVGDEVLKTVARILEATARKADCCARLGGDEFAVLLPDTNEGDAPFVVRRIQRALDDHNQSALPAISVSIGARIVDPKDPDALMAQADRAMYESKAQGPGDPAGDLEDQLQSWLEENPKIDFTPGTR